MIEPLEWIKIRNFKKKLEIAKTKLQKNVADRLPENSRDSFVDLQSQNESKKCRPKKKFIFSIKGWDDKFQLRICVTYCCFY